MSSNTECCPQLPVGKKCDYLDFVYRLTHSAVVGNDNKQQVRVPVEVAIHVRLERCSGGTELGNLVYSTTLMPGEKVRLFSLDRRSRFSYDSETQMSYRHERIAEEQQYMETFEKYMTSFESRDKSNASSTSSGSTSGSADTSSPLGTLLFGASADVSGSFNAASTKEFIREINMQAESSHNKSVNLTRESSSISFGEVQVKQHTEGESESSIESSSRMFENTNRCHAVSYLFYQVNKVQTVRLTAQAVRLRVIDQAGDSAIRNTPIAHDQKLTVIPEGVKASAAVTKQAAFSQATISGLSVNAYRYNDARAISTAEPMSNTVRQAAINHVMDDLKAAKVVKQDGKLTEEMKTELEFEFRTTIPTPGIVIKGCLDDCNVCEPASQEVIKLEIENKTLKNELLRRQIELLDQSQEYRCCPVNESEEDD
jgi:hypothetical protein